MTFYNIKKNRNNTCSSLFFVIFSCILLALNDSLTNMVKFQVYTCTYSLSANEIKNLTAQDFGITAHDYYTQLAIRAIDTGSGDVYFKYYKPFTASGYAVITVKNTAASAKNNITATVQIIYIKSRFYGGEFS